MFHFVQFITLSVHRVYKATPSTGLEEIVSDCYHVSTRVPLENVDKNRYGLYAIEDNPMFVRVTTYHRYKQYGGQANFRGGSDITTSFEIQQTVSP
jgi:hypothetical protein